MFLSPVHSSPDVILVDRQIPDAQVSLAEGPFEGG
jgi:hypothetical protein